MSLSTSHSIRMSADPTIRESQLDKKAEAIYQACCAGRGEAAKYGLQHQELIDLIAGQDSETAKKMLRSVMDNRGNIPGAEKANEARSRGYQRHAASMASEAGITGDVWENAQEIREHVKCIQSSEGLTERVKNFNRAYSSLSSAINQQERIYASLSTMKVEIGSSLVGKTAGEVYDLSHIKDESTREKIALLPVTAPVSGGNWYDGKGTRFEKIPFDREDPRFDVAYREVFKKDPPVYETPEQQRQNQAVASVRLAIARYKSGEAVQDYVRHNIYLAQYEPDKAPASYRAAVGELISEGKMKAPTQPMSYTGSLDGAIYYHDQYQLKGPSAIPYGQQESKFFADYAFRHAGESSRLEMSRPEDWGQHVKAGIALMVEERKEQGDKDGLANLKRRVDNNYRLLFNQTEYNKLFSANLDEDLASGSGPKRREAEALKVAIQDHRTQESQTEAKQLAAIEPAKLARELHLRPTEKLEQIQLQLPRLLWEMPQVKLLQDLVSTHVEQRQEVKPAAKELLQSYVSGLSGPPSSLTVGERSMPLSELTAEQRKLIEAEIVHMKISDLSFPRGYEPTRESFIEMKRKVIGFLYGNLDQFAELRLPSALKHS